MRTWLVHGLLALASIAAMFALNAHQKPAFASGYAEPEYTTATGTLSLQRGGDSSDIPLMTTHIVARDIERVARRYKLRELLIRAAAPSAQPASVELYVDITRAVPDTERDPQRLVQTELPIVPLGRLGSRVSIVSLGGGRPQRVVTGTLLLTEISAGDDALLHARGRLEMQVEANGGVEVVTGRIDGVIAWDATGA